MTQVLERDGTYRTTRRKNSLPAEIDLGRLCRAVERDRYELRPFRANRLEMVRQYLGKWYGDNASAAEVVVNDLGLYVEVVTQSLIDNAPRVMLSTFDQAQAPAVAATQQWVNDEFVRMNVAETYKRIAYDALFWVGVAKVSLATPADAAAEAWDVEAGQPFIEGVDPEDMSWDMTARRFSRCAYHACRYRLPVRLANALYRRGRQDEFTAEDRQDINAPGDERMHTLAVTTGYRDQIEDECDLWEVYLPAHRLVVTLRDTAGLPDPSREPVRVQPWVGPAGGPYHFFGIGIAPGNLNPKAPIMDLYDLARHRGMAYRKLMRRTRDTKKVTAFDGKDTDDATRLNKASDGDSIQVSNAAAIRDIQTGGPDRDLLTMFDHMGQQFSRRGGNMEVLGGRSVEARTATQEKLLNENASAGIGALKSAFDQFVQETAQSLMWFYHHHPRKVMQSEWSPPMLPEMKATREVYPGDPNFPAPPGAMRRTGTPPHVKIDTYSLAKQTPASRLAFVNSVLQQTAPFAPLLQQQGKTINMDELLKLYAELGNEPRIAAIFNLAAPTDPRNGQDTGPGEATMPAQTTRTYERISSGGQGPQAEKQDLAIDVARMGEAANSNTGETYQ